MSAFILVAIAIACTIVAYRTWGTFVANRLQLSDDNITPAHTMEDGIDYVPAKAPVLLGHHFASIAGASPIIGPIIAIGFGWLPALIWILVGGIFMGAVHDFVALVASVRHQGKTIGEVIEEYVGMTGKRLFALFAFAALILVVAVFTHVIAQGFATSDSSVDGGILATTHTAFVVLAVLFGIAVYRLKLNLLLATVIGVASLFGCVAIGYQLPIALDYTTWVFIILGYCVVAAVLPVQTLLQPRDYLNSFLLYIMMGAGIIGLLVATFTAPETTTIRMDAIGAFRQGNFLFMFPMLFVMIACGAVSGFHSLVASGTTSKQLDKETDAKIIGYGGMLIEVCLATLALAVVASMSMGTFEGLMAKGPIHVFQTGLGGFVGALGIPPMWASIFVGLAVSAFALTSLDTCTRLARFLFQEFFERRVHPDGSETVRTEQPKGVLGMVLENRFTGTLIPVVAGGALTLTGNWKVIWPIFGAANQMLAALALLAGSVWLSRKGVKYGFLLVPMVFMFTVTLSALALLVVSTAQAALYAPVDADAAALAAHAMAVPGKFFLCGLATLLFVLGVILLGQAIAVLRRGPAEAASRDEPSYMPTTD